MTQRKKFVAVLTASPALGSIIAMVLDCEEHLNVQTFCRPQSLSSHTRIAPLDIIICDSEVAQISAPQLAINLRKSNPKRSFQFLVMADSIDSQFQQACKFAMIDEVIVKPMSPLFLRERVLARLALAQGKATISRPKAPIAVSSTKENSTNGNIVQLFDAHRELYPAF